jgi:hypothetical protein
MAHHSLPSALLILLLAAGCGGDESAAVTSGTATAEETTETEAPEASESAVSDFSDADLDLYEQGIRKETEIVKAAQDRALNAGTPAERAQAAQQAWEEQSVPAAARAAGIPEERYRQTRKAVHNVFQTLDFQGKIDGPLEIDLTRVSDDVKAKLARDPFDSLTPSAAAALRKRMDRLVPLWVGYTELVAVSG